MGALSCVAGLSANKVAPTEPANAACLSVEHCQSPVNWLAEAVKNLVKS